MIVSAGRDNTILFWDTRSENKRTSTGLVQSVPVNMVSGAHSVVTKLAGKHRNSLSNNSGVTKAMYLNEYLVCSTGASDGLLKFWDVRGSIKTPITEMNPNFGETRAHGINSFDFDKKSSRLYVSRMNSKIDVVDMHNLEILHTFTHSDFNNSSFYIHMALSPCGNFIASGSKSAELFIWGTDFKSAFAFYGHQSEVSCVDWSRFDYELISCSDDMTVRRWQVPQIPKDPFAEPRVGFVKELKMPIPAVYADPISVVNVASSSVHDKSQKENRDSRNVTGFRSKSKNIFGKGTAQKRKLKPANSFQKKTIMDFFKPINKG
jgi:WD40 repeat protein